MEVLMWAIWKILSCVIGCTSSAPKHNPSCFLIHAKWKENLLRNMQILMQSTVTYGAWTAAFSFDLCFWHSDYKEEKNLPIVKALNWS